MGMIGSLGTVVFQVSNNSLFSGIGLGSFLSGLLNSATNQSGIVYKTPKNYQRQSSARWAEHEIIGQKPVAEFLGPGTEEVSFDMLLDIELGVKPENELEKLRNMRDTGELVFFILGNKPVLKNRVYITQLSENITRTSGKGEVQAIEVSISLKEYVLRPEEVAQQNANSTNQSSAAANS